MNEAKINNLPNEEPREAIFVRFIQPNLDERKKTIRATQERAAEAVKKFEIPQGPALINGQWI